MESALLYYISCCLLLLGTFSIMHSPWLPGDFLPKYCESYGIFLAYVVVLTVQCLLVLRRLALVEDGLVMAGLTLLLILDPAFFNNVFYTYKLNAGVWVSSISLVLSMGLYAVLIKVGGIPWTKRSATITVLAAVYVYYYPLGLNAGWTGAAVATYFHMLWWTPLLMAALVDRVGSAGPAQGQTHESRPGIDARMRQRFLAAGTLIVFYIALSHLLEAKYTYSLDVGGECMTPVLLAAGLLFGKLKPNCGRRGRKFIWVCGALAACCSATTASPTFQLPGGVVLSSFHYGLSAAALFMMYFWRAYRERYWAVAGTVFLMLVVSGASLADSIVNIWNLHSMPFFFLGLVFAVSSVVMRTPAPPTLAGGCFLISLLSLAPIQNGDKLAIFFQVWAIWIALVQWHFYRHARQRTYSVVGIFVIGLAAAMRWVSPNPTAWGVDYCVVLIGLLAAARLLNSGFLFTVFVSGTLAVPAYFARVRLASLAFGARRWISSGVAMTTLAFLLLPLAYYLSALKMRRRDGMGVRKTVENP